MDSILSSQKVVRWDETQEKKNRKPEWTILRRPTRSTGPTKE